jgi:uncharacterized OB-fold protein
LANEESTEVLSAPLVIEYPFLRTTGPVIGAFLSGLREQRVLGIRDSTGRVVCPPVEYDPESGAPLTEMVELGSEGVVTSWSWVTTIREGQPLQTPHALAFVRLDGADTAMLHVVDAPGPDAMATGARVRIRWATEPEGLITDIACFELTGESENGGN